MELKDYDRLLHEINDVKLLASTKVSQEECEQRRKDIAEEFNNAQHELSKIIGIGKVHSEQIGQLRASAKWIMGIVSGVIVSLVLIIIKGALNL